MGLVEQRIDELQRAKSEVILLLQDGPVMTGELIERLDHSTMNFHLTKMIGDCAGEWDGSPHQMALQDLIDEGAVEWWRDEQLNVLYGKSGSRPEVTGEKIVGEFFGKLTQILPDYAVQPRRDLPCEFAGTDCQVGLSVEKGQLEIYAERDCEEGREQVAWPVSDYKKLAAIITELMEWSRE